VLGSKMTEQQHRMYLKQLQKAKARAGLADLHGDVRMVSEQLRRQDLTLIRERQQAASERLRHVADMKAARQAAAEKSKRAMQKMRSNYLEMHREHENMIEETRQRRKARAIATRREAMDWEHHEEHRLRREQAKERNDFLRSYNSPYNRSRRSRATV
jgi:hypothetical protein